MCSMTMSRMMVSRTCAYEDMEYTGKHCTTNTPQGRAWYWYDRYWDMRG